MADVKKLDPKQTARWQRDNLEAARIILANPERYAGRPLVWAERVVENHEIRLAAERRRQARVNLGRMEEGDLCA